VPNVTSTAVLGQALVPEPTVDQGDPFLVEVPAEHRAEFGFRYYVYVSAPGFPVYGSNDLLDPEGWQRLGESCPGLGRERWCWAPCVRYVAGLDRPWVMLYSMARGAGETEGHQHHQLHRADSTSPAGPFTDSGEVLTEEIDFAIDPDVYRRRDGALCVAFATDFIQDRPLGTGLAEATIAEDLTHLTGPPRALARAHYHWQIYDPQRKLPWMTIPGVNWDTDTVVWHTLEGPVGGLVSPQDRDVYLYSGGCFFDYYAIGALLRERSRQP
jgi:hypothetical protein